MGWIKLQRVAVRPPLNDGAADGAQHEQQQTEAAAAAAGFPGKQQCPAAASDGSSNSFWDPWQAGSAFNVAYDVNNNTAAAAAGGPLSQQGSGAGRQGFTAATGSGSGSAGLNGSEDPASQGLCGSECVWDEGSIPREWQWEVFAQEVGCSAR